MPEIKKFGKPTHEDKSRPSSVALGIGGAGRNIITDIQNRSLSNVRMYEVGSESRKPEIPLISISKEDMKEAFHSKVSIEKRPLTSSEKKIKENISSADLVYLISGLGGETGSWSVPSFAELSEKYGDFTFASFAKPFETESKRRKKLAEKSLEKTSKHLDIAGIFPNEKLLDINSHLPIKKAFEVMNNIIRLPIVELNGVLTKKDMNDLKKFSERAHEFRVGAGYGKTMMRGKRAAEEALDSPWIDKDLENIEVILVVVAQQYGEGKIDADDALEKIKNECPNADILWGLKKDPSLDKRTRVTLLAGW